MPPEREGKLPAAGSTGFHSEVSGSLFDRERQLE